MLISNNTYQQKFTSFISIFDLGKTLFQTDRKRSRSGLINLTNLPISRLIFKNEFFITYYTKM